VANFVGGRCLAFALLSVIVLAGCNSQPSEAVAKRVDALSAGPTFTLQLPPQLTAGGSGLTASTTLTLGDRVQVKQPTGSAFAGVVNLGSGQTLLGRDDKTGDLWSVGSVQLMDRAVVSGFLKTAGTLGQGTGTTITGPIQQAQPLAPPTLTSVMVQFQNGASPVTIANDTTRTLSPGDYAAVSLGARSILALSTGDYRVDSLATQPQSTLRLTTTAGPIRLFIRTTLNWNSTVTAGAGDPTKLLVGYVGTAAITINTPFTGTLLSPSAAITLPTVSSPHSGAFFAKSLTTQPDVVITTQPFQLPCQGVVTDDGNACTTDSCDPATGLVTHVAVANGTTCSDGNACTQSDSCQAGACVGANPVACAAQDQCHSAGACAPATGLCSNPAKTNGTTCSDGNACTQSDSCQAGVCVGASPVACAAPDQCHTAGTCNTATGVCSNPAKADGASCSDGSACTQGDSCRAGSCVGSSPVLCAALDQCHVPGICDPASGACSNPTKANGSTCSDGSACTQGDSCQAGACVGVNTVTCNALDQCHIAGVCDPSSGACSNPPKADGASCSDGNACTQADTCRVGVCVGASPVVCAALDQCHQAGTCNASTGTCSNPAKANGSACSDGNSCTQSDACQAGACVGTNAVACAALDQCHLAGSCDPSSGTCSNPIKSDGAACTDANVCTNGDVCTAGLCRSGSAVASDDGNPCTVDVCDPVLGVSHTPVTAGTACDDGDACNGHETCNAIGFCAAGTAPSVNDGNPCTADACDPNAGVSHTPVSAGTACPATDACHQAGACDGSGTCTAGTASSVDDHNGCTTDSCDPTAGVQHVPVQTGTSCADSNVCNGQETCDATGICAAGTPLTIDDGNSCTTDACDPVTGVTHTLIVGCDRLSTVAGGRYETRASLLGQVTSVSGTPITTYAVTVFEVPVTGTPRSDLSLVTQSDGSFRARLTNFPEAVPAHTPPLHVLIRVAADGFLQVERDAYLRPGDALNLGSVVMIAADPAVTMIGPEGGTATDSKSLVSLNIPPGALASTTPIRITPITTRPQFPFPLPDTTATMYGVVLEPDGQKFAVPVKLSFANYRNLPPTLTVPVGSVDDVNVRWTHEGFAIWDGESFSTHITHFSLWDANASTRPPGVWIYRQSAAADPNKSSATTCVGSSASYGSGSLRQNFSIAHYERQGRSYDVTLDYDSGLAGSVQYSSSPSAPTKTIQASNPTGLSVGVPLKTIIADCMPAGSSAGPGGCSGGICAVGSTLALGFNQLSITQRGLGSDNEVTEALSPTALGVGSVTSVDLPLNADGTAPAPAYVPFDRAFTGLALGGGSCASGGGAETAAPFGVQSRQGSGVMTTADPGPQLHLESYELVYHRRSSNYGAGWGIGEVGEAYVAPDQGQADVVQGDGQKETFRYRPTVSVATTALTSVRTPMTVDPVTSERLILGGTGLIQKLNADNTLQTVTTLPLTGAPYQFAVAYTSAGRQFVVALNNALVTFDQAGNARTNAPLSVAAAATDNVPEIAAAGSIAYFTNATDNLIYRTDVSDAAPTLVPITAGDSGDPNPNSTGTASQVEIQTPRGLAVALDGSLYVASEADNLVLRLFPQTDGTIGPNSQVVSAIGDGNGSVLSPLGAALPAAEFPLKEPVELRFAPDGTLFIVTLYGAVTFDPAAQTARLLAVDEDMSNLFELVLSGNGSFFPLSPTAALFKAILGTDLYRVDVGLSSEYAPTRTMTVGAAGLTVVDSDTELVETYTWADTSLQRALLTSRSRRTGESLLNVQYVTGTDRIAKILDPTGGAMQFGYDGSGKLQSITDAGNRATQISVDSNGDLGTIFMPSGEERQFAYSQHRMTTATAPNGASSQYTYKDNGTSTRQPVRAAARARCRRRLRSQRNSPRTVRRSPRPLLRMIAAWHTP
jgi:YD repeat-containing protein